MQDDQQSEDLDKTNLSGPPFSGVSHDTKWHLSYFADKHQRAGWPCDIEDSDGEYVCSFVLCDAGKQKTTENAIMIAAVPDLIRENRQLKRTIKNIEKRDQELLDTERWFHQKDRINFVKEMRYLHERIEQLEAELQKFRNHWAGSDLPDHLL